VSGVASRINYGLDSVRFTNVVPAGSSVRAVSRISGVERIASGLRVELDIVVEIQGVEKPAIRARQILLLVEDVA
jgi:acyl dehydratase